MKRITAFILATFLSFALSGCFPSTEKSDIEFLTVEITKENYTEYMEFITTDAVIDDDGNIILQPYVSIKSKLYDEGWILFDVENANFDITWHIDNHYFGHGSESNILGKEFVAYEEGATTADNYDVRWIKGTYTFVKKDYVEQYRCEPGNRVVELTDGNFSSLAHHADYLGEFYPY